MLNFIVCINLISVQKAIVWCQYHSDKTIEIGTIKEMEKHANLCRYVTKYAYKSFFHNQIQHVFFYLCIGLKIFQHNLESMATKCLWIGLFLARFDSFNKTESFEIIKVFKQLKSWRNSLTELLILLIKLAKHRVLQEKRAAISIVSYQ